MSETMKDSNMTVNVGGELTHMNAVQASGGALKEYDSTPVGGPPSMDTDNDVREPLEFNCTTRIVGADATARRAKAAAFKRGQEFDFVASPSTTGQMYIDGNPDAIGRRFVVTTQYTNVSFQENAELNFTVKEKGAASA